MSAGYGNDNYNDNDSHDEGINSNDFATTWKIYLILFSKVGAEGGGLRADENQDFKIIHKCTLHFGWVCL